MSDELPGGAALQVDPMESRAVLVGTSIYETDYRNLEPVENNIKALFELLTDPQILDHLLT